MGNHELGGVPCPSYPQCNGCTSLNMGYSDRKIVKKFWVYPHLLNSSESAEEGKSNKDD